MADKDPSTKHSLFVGNSRLDEAYNTLGRSLKPAPIAEDPDAVRRLQKALLKLMGEAAMSKSFPNGFNAEPDGKYGKQTMDAVLAFQRKTFPGQFAECDGRAGIKTLRAMNVGLIALGGGGVTPPNPDLPKPDTVVVLQGAGFGNSPGQENPPIQVSAGVPSAASFSVGLKNPVVYKVWNGDPNRGAAVVDKVVGWINANHPKEKKLVLIGMSSGGANVSEVASRLGFEVRYLAACDAAYSSDSDPRRNLGFQAKQSEAFFQTLTNQFKQEFHGKPSAIKTFQDFSNDPEFAAAERDRKIKLAALLVLPPAANVLARGRINQGFIDAVHTLAVRKGNAAAFGNAKAALNAS